MPEIIWSQLRRRFTPGFETVLDHGVNEGLYDVGNTLQKFVPLILVSLFDRSNCGS